MTALVAKYKVFIEVTIVIPTENRKGKTLQQKWLDKTAEYQRGQMVADLKQFTDPDVSPRVVHSGVIRQAPGKAGISEGPIKVG